MAEMLTREQLLERGAGEARAAELLAGAEEAMGESDPRERWRRISREVLRPDDEFAVHQYLFELAYVDWDASRGPAPAWSPEADQIAGTNIGLLMKELGIGTYEELHRWSVERRGEFWTRMIERTGVRLREEPHAIVDPQASVEDPGWLTGASLNAVESCFSGKGSAIVWQREGGTLQRMTGLELASLTDRVAWGLLEAGFDAGDALAIDMPMTVESVAIYLGIIKAGMVVVSIADSFAPQEIATRLRIAEAKGVFTQDVIVRGGKTLPLYQKVVDAEAPRVIVLAAGSELAVELRDEDIAWETFLPTTSDPFDAVASGPDAATNVLFSSGTTGDPKAIPWTQLTPIKAAVDGYLHHDIRPGDVVAWPTNLGWMMGPWLIYAALVNRATIALFDGAPTTRAFAQFVRDSGVTMLGLVPSLVKAWRETGVLDGIDWSSVRCFSSTGEASNPEDYFWLMGRAGYRPVIEYCGGTEIGGGYITGTMVQSAAPATFSTKALGLDFVLLDEQGRETDNGEMCIVPPSIGLSTRLLNRDHHEVYFAGMPTGPRGEVLRRHGDQIEALPGGYYRAHGRVDDTMNLGGIKVSSAEIERVLDVLPGVRETAAIAVDPPGGGPSQLVVYVVRSEGDEDLQGPMQRAIRADLNPLFKIHDVVSVDALPRTASNKVMRRKLRAAYQEDRG